MAVQEATNTEVPRIDAAGTLGSVTPIVRTHEATQAFEGTRVVESTTNSRVRHDTSVGGYAVTVPRRQRRPSAPAASRAKFIVHESWEGVVEEVFSSYFLAQLSSQTMTDVHEWAEIRLEEISPEDHSLLREGAVFYWSIGYRDMPSGQRVRASIIRFRRLPQLSDEATEGWVNSVSDSWLESS